MNDTFSLSRFGLLLRKYTKEHFITYLLYAVATFGILIVVYGVTVLSFIRARFPQDAPMIYFLGGIVFGSSLFASSFYSFFHNKAKAVQYLNLPSSHAEKLTLGFVFTQIVFFSFFTGAFYLVDQMMCGLYNHFHIMPARVPAEYISQYTAKPLNFSDPIIKGGIIVAFVIASVSHLGSLSFEKNAFVKIALFILVIGAALLYTNYYSAKAMIPEQVMPYGMIYNKGLRIGGGFGDDIKGIVLLPEAWSNFIYWFLPGMLYLLFWVSCYFKLKEKQI